MRDRSYSRLMKDPGFSWMLVTQFLGALNDNVFKWAITFHALDWARQHPEGWSADNYVALIGFVFILPYLLLSDYAGQIADRFSKRNVLIATKSLEILAMAGAIVAFRSGELWAMLTVLFLMGAQAALFSPAKYGSMPELLPDADLSRGNALIEMSTFLAIILGGVFGALLYQAFSDQMEWIGLVALAIAIVGTLASLGIGRTPSPARRSPFSWHPFSDVRRGLVDLYRNRRLWLTALGISYFWFLGALLQSVIPLFAAEELSVGETATSVMSAAVAIGIGIGSLAAGALSGHKVELGLVPIGSLGLGVGSFFLAGAGTYPGALGWLVALGFFAGFYAVPLNALYQQKAAADARGRLIAANNLLNTVAILMASAFLAVVGGLFEFSPRIIMALAGLTAIAAIAYLFALLPDFVIRFVLWCLTHSIYRIRIVGPENVPLNGPALLVCNHLSFVDGLLVGACIQRFVRFMVYAPFFEAPVLGWFLRKMRAIPTGGGGLRGSVAAIRSARDELKAGHVACIFAEGSISRTGNLLPFKKGFERIVEGLDVPIIPVHLDQVWGSIFSFKEGKFFWKWPVRLFYPVTISFGEPLPAHVRAWEVRRRLLEMSGEAFSHRRKSGDLVHLRFIASAKSRWWRFCMVDSFSQPLRFGQALSGALLLARRIERLLPGQERVGLLLPASVGGALANMACLIAGKVPINLNFTVGAEAMELALARAETSAILTSRAFLTKAKIAQRPGMIYLEDVMGGIGRAQQVLWFLWFWLLPKGVIGWRYVRGPRDPEHLCTIKFSSGSTGSPKGVMLSHHNVVSNLEAIAQILNVQRNDRMLGVLPFFHAFGFTGALCTPLVCGFGAIYHANPLDAKTIGRLAREHRATILISTPTFCQAYYRVCDADDFRTLRHVVVGAERLRPELAAAFKEKFGLDMLEGYGLTEMGPVVSVNVPNVREVGESQIGHKPGTVGHPVPGVVAKVVDPETRADLAIGAEGLLLLKGPGRMVGYLADPEATDRALMDGWYVTGDIAVVDEDGFIRITDRMSRFSKIGGEMAPHGKIEDAIMAVPGVSSAVITGVPDPVKGERLIGFYVAGEELSPALLWQALGDSALPRLWLPKAADLRRVESLPTLGTGKIDLKAVKAMALALDVD
jgi:acyl-[acyl-carrier-protein]-phospholipid O-acyltransferase/long-chain-fatty-acid--[acyl-carrier-protein] ligase